MIICGQSDYHARKIILLFIQNLHIHFLIFSLSKIVVEEIPHLSTDAEMPVRVQVKTTTTTTKRTSTATTLLNRQQPFFTIIIILGCHCRFGFPLKLILITHMLFVSYNFEVFRKGENLRLFLTSVVSKWTSMMIDRP